MTYGLHIILRFELEQELLRGRPRRRRPAGAVERDASRSTSALDVPEDRLGCLQDVHWSAGGFGYFPTYQLGNVISVQIWERLREAMPDVDEQIERGEFGELHEWLREHLYVLGRKFTRPRRSSASSAAPIDPEPYLRYLRAKFGSLSTRRRLHERRGSRMAYIAPPRVPT